MIILEVLFKIILGGLSRGFKRFFLKSLEILEKTREFLEET
jgi:hypothetical protein